MNDNQNTVKAPVILFGDGNSHKGSAKSPSDYYKELYGQPTGEDAPQPNPSEIEVESQNLDAASDLDASRTKQMRGAKP